MRITSLSGKGLLSLDDFTLNLRRRVTFAVGPNGAGKSNTARLLTVSARAMEAGDGSSREVASQLTAFLQARHVGSTSPGIEVRVAVKLTDPVEQALMTEFIKAMVTGALVNNRPVVNLAEIDAWADTEITAAKLQPLMEGKLVTRHPGTEDGQWLCAYEFAAPSHDGTSRRYRWNILGSSSGTIVDAEAPVSAHGVNTASLSSSNIRAARTRSRTYSSRCPAVSACYLVARPARGSVHHGLHLQPLAVRSFQPEVAGQGAVMGRLAGTHAGGSG